MRLYPMPVFSTKWKRKNGEEDKYHSGDGSCSMNRLKKGRVHLGQPSDTEM